ncbi:hypothetical protein [Leeia sp.]|uniref:hypothetical protein n=1 Tax=Leeia sp. TaxID=2884678 RepID=UPI0035B27A74
MRSTLIQWVKLHPEAPHKPQMGQPCNGCGVCCAAELCPLARLRFLKRQGPCPALQWRGTQYGCGMLLAPERYLPFAAWWRSRLGQRCLRRWLGVGVGCDADCEVSAEEH